MEIISTLLKNKYVIVFLTLIVLFPIITNIFIFSWGTTITYGKLDTWIGFFATYYGAIVGGIIAGALTLIGVRITITSTMDGVNKTIEEQKRNRDEDILMQTNKERLNKFYGPMDNLIHQFNFNHGAHEFSHLDFKEQTKFLEIMNNNILYTDSDIYLLAIEMNWAFKENDYSFLDEKYIEIKALIIEELNSIRKQLKLPIIDF